MLDPRLLKAFVSIVEAGSFTLAAERLHMTQSTISQQLARLEQSIGQALIDRHSRPLQLTTTGEYLIGYARRILALQLEVQALVNDPTGSIPIRIGLPEDIINPHMALALRHFSQSYPNVRLDVTTGLSRNLMERYRNGQFDVVVAKESAASADHYVSFPEKLAWFESINNAQNWTNLIALVTFPQGGLYRDEMFELIERSRKNWYVSFNSNSLASVLVAVEAGLGLSLLPVSVAKGYQIRPYTDLGEAQTMTLSMYVWEKDHLVSELALSMKQVLQQRFNEKI